MLADDGLRLTAEEYIDSDGYPSIRVDVVPEIETTTEVFGELAEIKTPLIDRVLAAVQAAACIAIAVVLAVKL